MDEERIERFEKRILLLNVETPLFSHRDDGAVILLDLLFPQGQGGYERNIEAFFDRHEQGIVISQ